MGLGGHAWAGLDGHVWAAVALTQTADREEEGEEELAGWATAGGKTTAAVPARVS